jgi:hypothetical protein
MRIRFYGICLMNKKIDFMNKTRIKIHTREENVYTLKRLSENDLICQQKSKYTNGKH